jgi:serine/threonine protein phosphatase PrpC
MTSTLSLFALLFLLLCGAALSDEAAVAQAIKEAAANAVANAPPPAQQRVARVRASAVAASGHGSAAIEAKTGKLLVWGLFDNAAHAQPKAVTFGSHGSSLRVTAVALGGYHGLARVADGSLWSFGRPLVGVEKASGVASEHAVRLGGALMGRTVTHFSAGNDHNVAVDSDGRVVTWGANSRGQLGSGDVTPHAVPHAVTSLDAVVRAHGGVRHVCAGSHHTALLTNDGSLFTWGASSFGATALGRTDDVLAPTAVAPPTGADRFTAVSCGGDHTIVQTDTGLLFAAGWNEHGQLCAGHTNDSAVLVPVQGVRNVKSFDAGQYATSAFISADGLLFTCGSGEGGTLGHGHTSVALPTQVNLGADATAVAVDMGFQHTIVQLADGSVVAFGNDLYSQLGEEDDGSRDTASATDSKYGRVVFDGESWLGVAESANGKVMLDRVVVRVNATALNNGHNGAIYIGVYDGHGGDTAVAMLEQMLHTALLRELVREAKTDQVLLDYDHADPAFARSFAAVNKAIRAKPSSKSHGAVALAAVLQVHEDFCELPFYRLFAGFVGDCGLLVSERGGASEVLSVSHRVDNEDERKRVLAAGGTIRNGRVGGMLMPTRAFGDSVFDEKVVPATPDVRMLDITTAHNVLVFGTDGLFDFVDNEAVLSVARDEALTPKQAASKLVQTAIDRGSHDNIAVVVVRPAPLQTYLCGGAQRDAEVAVDGAAAHDEL